MNSPNDASNAPAPPVQVAPASLNTRLTRCAIEWVCLSVAGMASFVLPIIISPPAQILPAPLFPVLRTAIESSRLDSFIALAVVGLLGGVFCRLRFTWIGLACVTLFPLAAFAEIAKNGTSHNLIPFELVMYGLYSLVPLATGAMGRGLKRLSTLGRTR